MQRFFLPLGAVALLFVGGCSSSDEPEPYPNRPIEVIVPFAPGGGSDTFARIVKAEIEAKGLLPEPLVIINSPGAGGTIGSRRVKNAKPDGYTVLLLHDGILTAKYSGKTLYGPEAFEQIAGTGRTGMVIAVHANSEYEKLSDLLNDAAENPDTVTFAANLGAPSHFAGLMLEQAHGKCKFRFAQTGGGADRFAAIKGEHAVATSFSLEEYLRFQPDGVKALAFLGKKRHEELPNLKTAIEQGVNVRHDVTQYWWMPEGTPDEEVAYFAEALREAMASEDLQKKLRSMKIDPIYMAGDELATHLKETSDALASVDAGAKSPLPDVPAALALVALLFGVVFAIERFRAARKATAAQPTPANRGDRWSFVLIAAVLVVAYALATIVWKLPLGVATALFVGTLALVIAWGDARNRLGWMLAIVVAAAVVMGGLFHIVFTRLFELGL